MQKINWINGQAGGTPLSAENLNLMQTYIEEAIGEDYSSDEYDTGKKWIDGKTIYGKVKLFTSAVSFNTPYSMGITPDTVVDMRCFCKYGSDSSWRPLPWLYSQNNTVGVGSWAGGFYFKNQSVYFQAGDNLIGSSKIVFVMEYTK